MPDQNAQTRRQRLEAREETIVTAAHDEFIEHGFEGAKMAAIARRAGVAEGTLYLYFKNKNALLGAVVGEFYARLTSSAAQGVTELADTTERLAFLAQNHLKSCLAQWSVLELAVPVFWRMRDYSDSEFIGFNRTYVAIFDAVIREGISRGDLRDDLPPHMIRDLFFGTLEHSVRTFLVRGSAPGEKDLERAGSYFMAMLGPALKGDKDPQAERGAPDLIKVADRLEILADRLEKNLK